MKLTLAIILLLTGCESNNSVSIEDTHVVRTVEYQQEINTLLLIDKQNKLLEEQYLREIAIAQDNNDEDAYKFYFSEYVAVPRIPLEDWMSEESNFYPRKSAKQVVLEYRQEN